MKIVGSIILFVYLLAMSVYDIRKREIQMKVTAVAAVLLLAGQVSRIVQGELSWYWILGGVVPGLIIIAISWCTRGQIGIGDGIIFIVSGIFLGFYENEVLLFLSLLFSAAAGGILVLLKRMGRKDAFPFVPFVCAGYGVMSLWEILG